MRKSFLVCLLFTGNVFAGYPPMPERCPHVSDIQAVGIHRVIKLPYSDHLWAAYQLNETYGTEETWTFSLGEIDAPSSREALVKAQNVLASLKLGYGPEEIEDEPRWICIYRVSDGYQAATTTPSYSSFSFSS